MEFGVPISISISISIYSQEPRGCDYCPQRTPEFSAVPLRPSRNQTVVVRGGAPNHLNNHKFLHGGRRLDKALVISSLPPL